MSEAATPTPSNSAPQTTESASEHLNNGERAEGSQAPKAPSNKYKTKVNGREVEVDSDTLLKHYQKQEGSEQKLREAAKARKEVESFYEQLQNDPEAILSDPRLSIKKRELAEKWLMEELQASLSEPQDARDIELAKIKKELEKYQTQEKTAKEQKEHEEYQSLVDTRRDAIATTLSKAMEYSPLSQDPDTAAATLKEMAQYMRLCRDAGYEASPEEIAQHVESRYNKSYQQLANRLEGDQLIQFLGEQVVKKIRQADLQRLQKQREQPAPQQETQWESNQYGSSRKQRDIVDPQTLRNNFKK